MKEISLIVPVYNVASYIEACMHSICQQTFKGEFEVIVVDDCGTDNSIELAESVLKNGLPSNARYSILHHDHNRGLSAARNTGDEVSEGIYTLYVDSDDQLTPICLEKLFEKAEATGADLTYGAYETFQTKNPTQTTICKGPFIMAWNKLIRKDFLTKHHIRFIEGLVHEDNPWNFEVLVNKPVTVAVPDVTYRYLVRENSLQTDKDFQKHYAAYCQILKEYSRIISNLQSKEEVAKTIPFLERNKALFFALTQEKGTFSQLYKLYSIIREVCPKPKCSKPDFHYYIPAFLGFWAYRKFYGYHLC